MFCPKCGKINPDSSEICSGCSAQLHTENEEKNSPKKGKWLKGAAIVIAVLIVVTIVVLLLSGCGGAKLPEEHMTF
ncbi:MAG: hypothetical protein IJD91_05220 [Clostridia bacterium]|nr:hypothetical protein [Clostridia bacterium]